MSLSNAVELAVLDSLLGSSSPATLQIGLSTDQPHDDGTELHEVTGAGYARMTISNNAAMFPAAFLVGDIATKKNNVMVMFPQATAPWGTVTHWFLYDTVAARMMLWGALTAPISVGINETVRFNPTALEFRLD